MTKLGDVEFEEKTNIDDMLHIENPDDICSKKILLLVELHPILIQITLEILMMIMI